MSPGPSLENPILNSPYKEPTRHYRFDANSQITDVIDPGRRGSSYFLPIAAPKKKGAPGLFDATDEKKEESGHVNRIRQLVERWRDMGRPDITPSSISRVPAIRRGRSSRGWCPTSR
jgi:type III restriction enzyme